MVAKGKYVSFSTFDCVYHRVSPRQRLVIKETRSSMPLPTRSSQSSAVDRCAAVTSKGGVFDMLWTWGGQGRSRHVCFQWNMKDE